MPDAPVNLFQRPEEDQQDGEDEQRHRQPEAGQRIEEASPRVGLRLEIVVHGSLDWRRNFVKASAWA